MKVKYHKLWKAIIKRYLLVREGLFLWSDSVKKLSLTNIGANLENQTRHFKPLGRGFWVTPKCIFTFRGCFKWSFNTYWKSTLREVLSDWNDVRIVVYDQFQLQNNWHGTWILTQSEFAKVVVDIRKWIFSFIWGLIHKSTAVIWFTDHHSLILFLPWNTIKTNYIRWAIICYFHSLGIPCPWSKSLPKMASAVLKQTLFFSLITSGWSVILLGSNYSTYNFQI